MFKKFFTWIKGSCSKIKAKMKKVNWKKVYRVSSTILAIVGVTCSIVFGIRNRNLRKANITLAASLAEKTAECSDLYNKLTIACKYVKQYFQEAAQWRQRYYDVY